MPRFAYTARDRAGQPVSAELDAPGRKDALRILAARGLQVANVIDGDDTLAAIVTIGADVMTAMRFAGGGAAALSRISANCSKQLRLFCHWLRVV